MSVTIDWKGEKDGLKQPLNWWRPTAGAHKVKILTDGEFYTTEFQDRGEVEKIRFEIEVDVRGTKEKFVWGVTRGTTSSSLYGQMVLIGASRGSLKDAEITLIVKGEGKNKDYLISEAVPLMNQEEMHIK